MYVYIYYIQVSLYMYIYTYLLYIYIDWQHPPVLTLDGTTGLLTDLIVMKQDPLSLIPMSHCNWPRHQVLIRTNRGPTMGDGGVFHTPGTDFSRPVEELEYTCLLKNTFTEVSHDRVFKTWQTPSTYPECVFCGKMYWLGTSNVRTRTEPVFWQYRP